MTPTTEPPTTEPPTTEPPTTRRWLLAALAAAAVVVVAGLALFQPWKLWIDETVDEAAPVAAATPVPSTAVTPTTALPGTTVVAAPAPDTTVTPAPAPVPSAAEPPGTTAAAPATTPPPAPSTPSTPSTSSAPTAPPPTPAPTAAPEAPAPQAPPPVEPAPTAFRSKAHGTSGTVRLITLDDGSRVLRIEDLDTDNGPDLKLVLSTDADGYRSDGAVNLGTLKGNKGSQNYEIPADVDLTTLRSVVVWCKRFDVDFGVAALPGA